MKAMAITGHGKPEEVFTKIDIKKPDLGEYDILVRVLATSVNPLDCKIRSFSSAPRQFPLVLGFDVCGIIENIGSRVIGFKEGDKVYASPNVFRPGANAEYVALDYRSAAIMPDIEPEVAAAVPLAAITAYESLHERGKIQPGQTILVHAGAGGVGHFAIQFARFHGCKIITTAGRQESIHFCKNVLEADHVINYNISDFEKEVMDITDGKGCPIVIDAVGGNVFTKSLNCVSVNGSLISIVPAGISLNTYPSILKNISLHFEFMGIPTIYNLKPEKQGQLLTAMANLINQGLLKPHIDQVYTFDDLPQAHIHIDSGRTIGKVVVKI